MKGTLAGRRALVSDAHTTSALAIVRSLSEAGASVTVMREKGRFDLAALSRHAHRVVAAPSVEQTPTLFLEALFREIDSAHYDVLIPTTDSAVAAIRTVRARVERSVAIALPPDDALLGAQDKKITVERAAANGVRVPRTRVFASLAEVDDAADRLRYPCVVKPRFSRYWDGIGPMVRGTVKYARSATELRRIYQSAPVSPELLLAQEFVNGTGVGVFALMCEGEARVVFVHRRVREANPTGGRASLAESIAPDPRLVAPALRLLSALRWTGVAMVEFKDPGPPAEPVAMEVNGRFWGSLPLAIAAGIDFPALLVRQVLGLPVTAPVSYAVGVRCRHLKGDLSHLIATLKGRPEGWTGPFPGRIQAIAAIVPWPGRWRPFNLRISDPMPALGEAAEWMRDAGRSLLGRSGPNSLKGVAQQP